MVAAKLCSTGIVGQGFKARGGGRGGGGGGTEGLVGGGRRLWYEGKQVGVNYLDLGFCFFE